MQEISVIEKINKIYEWLQDDKSKLLYDCRLQWLITGDNSYVESIVKNSHPQFPVWNQKDESECVKLLPANCKIFLYGAGTFAKRVLPYMKELDVVVLDRNYKKYADGYEGFQIVSPEYIAEYSENKRIVICTTKYYEEVYKFLLDLGVAKEEIVDIRAFFKCGTGDDYFYEDFIKYTDNEVFVDAGCFDLSTTLDLVKVCGKVKKVYAFEPDEHNYQLCINNKEKNREYLPDVEIFNSGTWNEKTTLQFDASADGCSHVGEGSSVIKTDVIDDIISIDEEVTFIKMDVEGAELQSLKGAAEHIKKYRPKLAICIYHKPEDMWELPWYIKQLVPDYKFYLRSYSNADNEMVLYAIC